MKPFLLLSLQIAACTLALHDSDCQAAEPVGPFDVIVYEGTPAGVTAAVAAARQGRSVALIEMNNHVGGVVSGGLVATDIGNRDTVGGLSAEFFSRILDYYTKKYGADSKQVKAARGGIEFEPHVAELVFEQMLQEQKITVWKKHRLQSVTQDEKGNITSITVDDLAKGISKTFSGRIFIDASYEGDLIAAAKVPFRFGREARSEYNEYLAGISAGPDKGKADHRIMSYNYRVSLTPVVENRVLIPKPAQYDPEPWRTRFAQRITTGKLTKFIDFYVSGPGRAGPNDKLDTNWFDFPGSSDGYADGDWTTRDALAAKMRDSALSMLYYLQNDPELPEAFRNDMHSWGLPKDEFTDNGHFPFQCYVREARRMVGQYVLRESDLTQNRYKPNGIATGSYGVDCHIIQDLEINGKRIPDFTPHTFIADYDIPYACLTPQDRPGQPGNLIVPVCLSATHVAYCSLRMEPVYMMLGHAAGDAAHLALAQGTAVQKVDTERLRELLLKEKSVLDCGYQPPVKIAWAPQHPKPGESVQFKVETISPLKDPLANIWWDFVGNGTISAQGEQAKATFSLDKIYSISLIVEDKAGRLCMATAEVPVGKAEAGDLTLDENDAEMSMGWDGDYPKIDNRKDRPDVFLGTGIHYDQVRRGEKRDATMLFKPQLTRAGSYELCLGFRPAAKQSTNTPVTIQSTDGTVQKTVNQSNGTSPFPFTSLGQFRFEKNDSASILISNDGASGKVVVDSVRWVWIGE